MSDEDDEDDKGEDEEADPLPFRPENMISDEETDDEDTESESSHVSSDLVTPVDEHISALPLGSATDVAHGVDDEKVTLDSVSLMSKVLVLPKSSNSSSSAPCVPPGVPFMGLETGFNMPSFSKVKPETVSVQSKSIEKELDVLREKDLLAEADTNATTRIRPILEVGQQLKEEVTRMEAVMRGSDQREPSFIDRVKEVIDELEGLLELLHLPSACNDTSYQSLLDMSLSVLATLASSLFSSPETGEESKYFRLSKRSLMVATSHLPESHLIKPIIASHWGTLYFQRFQVFGNSDHIDQAIKFHQQSVDLVPEQPMLRSWLGRSYLA
ncbi:unnamed protein product, partial [Rhizoctonia solani]